MKYLSLVKTLSRLQEEQTYFDEVFLDHYALAFTRGSVIEVAGQASSGKTSLAMSLLSKLTRDGEVCALVDSSDSFDPCSAVTSRVDLENLLWIKCGGNMEKAFLAADYLVQAKGFGAIWLNLSGLSANELRRVPRTYWYRFRTRIRETPTLLLVTSAGSVAGSASQRSFSFSRTRVGWSGKGRFKLLRELWLSYESKMHTQNHSFPVKIEMDYREI